MNDPRHTRRGFLKTLAAAALAAPSRRQAPPVHAPVPPGLRRLASSAVPRESSLLAALRAGDARVAWLLDEPSPVSLRPAAAGVPLSDRFADLRRHFIFEYYPWYRADPWWHWNQWDRDPPDDIAASAVPRLGPYDSRSRAVLEQQARWIADSGAGAVNVSWWGPGSPEDQALPLLMDVMRDHDLKVSFHLEPYAADHGARWQEDVLYLLREYGERRRFDCLLLLEDEDGSRGPLFKGFRTILPSESRDCHGVVRPISDYTPDDVYARQFDALRKILGGSFDHVTLLADSLDFVRAPRAGFDGIAVYDNFVTPLQYAAAAQRASQVGLLFSFNVNPGYDAIEPRLIAPGSCYSPQPFAPPAAAIDWSRADERERAAALAVGRIVDAFEATLAVQTEPSLANADRGFFLVYLNSFNEWHEGHAFEPMKDAADLLPGERRFGYHNPFRGEYRLAALGSLLRPTLATPSTRRVVQAAEVS